MSDFDLDQDLLEKRGLIGLFSSRRPCLDSVHSHNYSVLETLRNICCTHFVFIL